jgi:hypothetical protein
MEAASYKGEHDACHHKYTQRQRADERQEQQCLAFVAAVVGEG